VFQTKVAQEIKTHFLVTNFFVKNHAFFEIMWKNIVEWGRPQMTMWHMCIAYWVTKAKHTHNM